MAQKVSFSIEDAKVVSENPNSNFAVLSLDFFASGRNLHDMYVSEETLFKTAETIKNCPLVWKYDHAMDDIYTHDKDEVPCGFIPSSSKIESRTLEDGRTMLSTIAYVWKRYTGELLGFFKRDGGKKPVSVEMTVNETRKLPNGLVELLDFKYEGVTLLGSFITPAIPMANANVLSFAKEYEEDLAKEFADLLTFPYKSIKDINPALRGIKPKVSLEQANAIARQADAIGKDKETNGWAIAIASFKKTHAIENGRWVEKRGSNEDYSGELKVLPPNHSKEMETPMEEEKKEQTLPPTEMAEEAQNPSEEKLSPEEKEEIQEEEKVEGQKFNFPQSMSFEAMQNMFAEEDSEEEIKMAKEECAKGEFANPGVLMAGMFAKMCKMSLAMAKALEESKAYMAENAELKQFKAETESRQKEFAVKSTIEELAAKVELTNEAREEMLAEAEKYSFADIESWKTFCKAKSFEFAVKQPAGKSDVVKVGLPHSTPTTKKTDDLWS